MSIQLYRDGLKNTELFSKDTAQRFSNAPQLIFSYAKYELSYYIHDPASLDMKRFNIFFLTKVVTLQNVFSWHVLVHGY